MAPEISFNTNNQVLPRHGSSGIKAAGRLLPQVEAAEPQGGATAAGVGGGAAHGQFLALAREQGDPVVLIEDRQDLLSVPCPDEVEPQHQGRHG